jgi:hypothetical protein
MSKCPDYLILLDFITIKPGAVATKNEALQFVIFSRFFSQNARFKVLTAVIMNSSIFYDITPCSPLKAKQRFGGRHRPYSHG